LGPYSHQLASYLHTNARALIDYADIEAAVLAEEITPARIRNALQAALSTPQRQRAFVALNLDKPAAAEIKQAPSISEEEIEQRLAMIRLEFTMLVRLVLGVNTARSALKEILTSPDTPTKSLLKQQFEHTLSTLDSLLQLVELLMQTFIREQSHRKDSRKKGEQIYSSNKAPEIGGTLLAMEVHKLVANFLKTTILIIRRSHDSGHATSSLGRLAEILKEKFEIATDIPPWHELSIQHLDRLYENLIALTEGISHQPHVALIDTLEQKKAAERQ